MSDDVVVLTGEVRPPKTAYAWRSFCQRCNITVPPSSRWYGRMKHLATIGTVGMVTVDLAWFRFHWPSADGILFAGRCASCGTVHGCAWAGTRLGPGYPHERALTEAEELEVVRGWAAAPEVLEW